MDNKKSALGRGLGTLLGESSLGVETKAQKAIPSGNFILSVPLENIFPCKGQPRKKFDKNKLQKLANSIKANGILQPIIVKLKQSANSEIESDKYEIIAGERRWRAAQLAGVSKIPVIVKAAEEKIRRQWALLENIQREDLNVLEEAQAFQAIIDNYGMEKNDLAEALGIDRSSLVNKLRILNLPKQVQELIVSGQVSLGHAKVILSLTDVTDQIEIANELVKKSLSVRALEKLVQKKKNQEQRVLGKPVKMNALALDALTKELESVIGSCVAIQMNEKGKGKLVISLSSHEALNQTVLNIKKGWGRTYGV